MTVPLPRSKSYDLKRPKNKVGYTLEFDNPDSIRLLTEAKVYSGLENYADVILESLQLSKAVWSNRQRGYTQIVLVDPDMERAVTLSRSGDAVDKNFLEKIIRMFK